ncbi:hypothetical protein [Sphingobium yanoikuyae]|uniref:Uncharacterized protein n=1 Tax=Sphingobium yanoikuyae TaxID=13690 RepID=A0A0J9FM08_SPHYA|nr:hypothetical protein [Sphingobium yanoikuyae]ATP20962.1 hypothetical protein BV87_22955 [Sphingobium yanoikuyae]KMW29445.1 hypothetical protein BV87_12505 [Sphingobium yanoikuyae]
MIARYTVHLKQPIRMRDHWPIDVLGARLTLVGDGDMVSGLLFTFTGQPTSLAPTMTDPEKPGQPPTISVSDPLHTLLRQQVRNGFSFMQALFPVQVAFDRTDAEYEGETPEETDAIAISRFTYGEADDRPLALTYDYFTRAMMAAEKPYDERYRLFATLTGYAREASKEARYIDAFRYYFLILDAFFSNGQFKKAGLEKAFKGHAVLMDAINSAKADFREDRTRPATPTGTFLRGSPTRDEIADHLIERRGHYFHSNRRKPGAWSPEKQDEARDLSWLCSMICFYLSEEYSAPMFAEELGARHFAEATKSGAIIVLRIDYTYVDDDGDGKPKQARTNINMPGTRVTRKMATEITQNFVQNFIESQPASSLMHAICREEKSGQSIFEIRYSQELP